MSYVDKVDAHQMSGRWEANTEDLFDVAFHQTRHSKVLDFGCGTGRLSVMLAKRGCDVIGVDPSLAMVQFAERYGSSAKFQVGGVPLGFPRGTFSASIASNVLGHVFDLPHTLWDLMRVTKVHGHIGVLNASALNTAIRWPANKLSGYQSDPTIQHRFSRTWLANAMALLGCRLKVSRMSGDQLLPWRSPLDAVFISVFEVMPMPLTKRYTTYLDELSRISGIHTCQSR